MRRAVSRRCAQLRVGVAGSASQSSTGRACAITSQVAADRLRVIGQRLAARPRAAATPRAGQRAISFEAPRAQEALHQLADARRTRSACCGPARTSARAGHALHRGFVDAHHAVVEPGQAADSARPSPSGSGAGDHAERRRARVQRAARSSHSSPAGAHHPAPERGAAEAPAGEAAAHRRAEQHRGPRLRSRDAGSACRGSARRPGCGRRSSGLAAAAKRASALDVRLVAALRAAVGEDARRGSRRAPAARASSPSPRPASTARAPAPLRALMRSFRRARRSRSRARSAGRQPSGSSWRRPGASRRAGSRPPIRSSRRLRAAPA